MRNKGFLTLLLIATVATNLSTARAASDEDVIAEMAKLLTNPPPSWVHGGNICSGTFVGVTCNTAGRITKLNLTNMRLTGLLTPLLSSLTCLVFIDLKGNSLSGARPSLSVLSYLTHLKVANFPVGAGIRPVKVGDGGGNFPPRGWRGEAPIG
ncbi:hypothetical protein HU200_062376 [Digitaria exilis]|uniref:Leucine-rich repeat-containing N-terminal plant-type domain-containing protein n=1 Tax=Digitaria exilis TaxID=1010633 RepID=A0A835A5K2_9POAL|nr:hypothetical protein HU200_062376 [Digitaria exilis]